MDLKAGNTVLLPVIPTLMPDGQIEMRVATGNLQNFQFQSPEGPDASGPATPKKRPRRAKKAQAASKGTESLVSGHSF